MKQLSLQITDETARQIAALARHWGLPRERHNTPVIERAIATIHMFEIGYGVYQARLAELKSAGDRPVPLERHTIGGTPMTTTAETTPLLLLMRACENTLRAGYSLLQSLDLAAGELPDPLRGEIAQVTDAIREGQPVIAALTEWAARSATPDVGLFVDTLREQLANGGNLADKLAYMARLIEQRQG